MPKYNVSVPCSGYSRGSLEYTVEAKNEDEALDTYDSTFPEYNIVRDDMEKEPDYAEAYELPDDKPVHIPEIPKGLTFHTSLGEMAQEFTKAFVKPENINVSPELPNSDGFDNMYNWIEEELEELGLAYATNDTVAFADALADLIYITVQQGTQLGFPMDDLIKEVHKSNMSKADADGNAVYKPDGKVGKSSLFKEPELLPILEYRGFTQ